MKGYFFLVVIIGMLIFTYGCQQAQQSTTPPPILASTAASAAGTLASASLMIDTMALEEAGVTNASIISASTPTYTSGWWNVTFDYTDHIEMRVQFKVKDVSGNYITTIAGLQAIDMADVDQIQIVLTTYTIGLNNYGMTFGSIANPLIFSGVGSNSSSVKSINGPVELSVSDADGNRYNIYITYSNYALSSSGWPNGDINFSIKSGATEIIAGRINCNGSSAATLTFTSGYSSSYSLDLLTGIPTAASL